MRSTLLVPWRAVLLGLILAACGPSTEEAPPPEAAPAAPPAPTPPADGARKGKAPKERVDVQVYFLDEAKYASGAEGAIVPVTRKVVVDNPPRNALWQLFKGPGPKERERGLSLVQSGAAGFETLRVQDGVAHVTLKGGCEAGGATVTVYDLIVPTLKQFDEIAHVKVYDPAGHTADPTGAGDSRPACLEP